MPVQAPMHMQEKRVGEGDSTWETHCEDKKSSVYILKNSIWIRATSLSAAFISEATLKGPQSDMTDSVVCWR